ncbi:Pseudouridylate synthase A [Ignavibacterium album JCM 16511]|uniref:tRNA pseudouridine synthase A n=1 Tax=Ignavibacterium album (strain DSM 19864 / JCM 16511 / NBRC 101810 / Mat9-16) TaxID=945713 RepID=I0ALT9_IGNAJ|nr:tRNA pseudouridine(38-40) synthase TruA [Ignavibacterium album]AFH49946.1 Pseudouridylate synthase A [Ignavibacterium album JCM 16511]
MNNYKLILQYDGSRYSGWQIQENSITIQQEIISAIKIILKEEVNLIGSGRTDSGVHALGQVANFRTEKEIDLYKFQFALNSILPNDISVTSVEKVHENFHSRFDAKKRTYIYLISQFKSPFYKNYSFFYPYKVELKKLNDLSNLFIGKKNYSSFCKRKSEVENKFCEVTEISWSNQFDLIVFKISADRFLHGMVRAIVGTLLKALKMEKPEEYIQEVFRSEDRDFAGEAVPAKGLFLYKVEY